ncbi:hypothetical protein [Burkholderia seminalis]|uniref:hypothetical protein n=1 Tax=Burkholderia seminalis TaxID=488731 RepID=UPI0014531274|nr:hypothetical protein [Burkholderia seminalis]MCA8435349.1 hypothetical protein [Burkholderia seminalis]VWC35801.1 hypothetical protein BSE24067_06676 [Burkholderia seminalis]
MNPTDYIAGERAAAEVLAYIQVGVALPDELESAFSRLSSEASRSGFFRVVQKHIERRREA